MNAVEYCLLHGLKVADVDGLAHQRVAALGEVDADLVGAARLQAHLAEGRRRQPAQRLDVGDGLLAAIAADVPGALGLELARASNAVTTVGDEVRLDPRGLDGPLGDGQVSPRGGVALEDLVQRPFGQPRLGEAEQPRGVLVDAVDRVQGGRRRAPARAAPGPANQVERGARSPCARRGRWRRRRASR